VSIRHPQPLRLDLRSFSVPGHPQDFESKSADKDLILASRYKTAFWQTIERKKPDKVKKETWRQHGNQASILTAFLYDPLLAYSKEPRHQ